MKFQSTKLIEGFSTCFRQWKATTTHCQYLHGYSIYFNVTFEGELDERNWVVDFGFMKRSKTKIHWDYHEFTPDEWFRHMFDHSVVIAEDDPELNSFKELSQKGVIQLRIVKKVGCEMFAKLVFETLNDFLYKETEDRARVIKVECFEHCKNSAICSE